MQGMGIFNSTFYERFRPFYPVGAFTGLRENLMARGFAEPFCVADIGCGTGHSSVSLFKTGILARVIGVDSDPSMLARARELSSGYHAEFREGSGEQSGLDSASMDAVVVASAFHWMDPVKAESEFRRILKPNGIVRIIEYQFPKAKNHPVLNEWIRRQFNLEWKAPAQIPRGDFSQVTAVFRNQNWSFLGEAKPLMIEFLGSEEVAGLILSQSRVLHYEETLKDRSRFHAELIATISEMMGTDKFEFDFKLAWAEFGV